VRGFFALARQAGSQKSCPHPQPLSQAWERGVIAAGCGGVRAKGVSRYSDYEYQRRLFFEAFFQIFVVAGLWRVLWFDGWCGLGTRLRLVVHGFLDVVNVATPDSKKLTNFWPGKSLSWFGGEEVGAKGAEEGEAEY
jgi:hypothetical protein